MRSPVGVEPRTCELSGKTQGRVSFLGGQRDAFAKKLRYVGQSLTVGHGHASA